MALTDRILHLAIETGVCQWKNMTCPFYFTFQLALIHQGLCYRRGPWLKRKGSCWLNREALGKHPSLKCSYNFSSEPRQANSWVGFLVVVCICVPCTDVKLIKKDNKQTNRQNQKNSAITQSLLLYMFSNRANGRQGKGQFLLPLSTRTLVLLGSHWKNFQ